MPAHEPSTAPRPGPHVLVDSSATAIAGCGSILLIAASAGLIFAVAAGSTLAIIVLGLVVVLGAIGLGAALVEQRRWEPLELRFPTWPLPLGSASSVEVIRRARQTVPDADYQLTAQLTCTERVTYTSGKETHTESDDVYDRTLRGAGSLRSNTFVGRLDLQIPLDAGAPTVDLGSNEVEWSLTINVEQLSWLMAKAEFTLVVSSDLDPSPRDVQDAPADDVR